MNVSRVTKKFGAPPPLDGGVSDPEKYDAPPQVLPRQIWWFYVKRLVCNYGRDPQEKFDPSRPAFQGHSRSLEPKRIDRLSLISY